MNRLLILLLVLNTLLFSNEGQKVYEEKCASCHQLYVPVSKLKENFMEHNNSTLELKAPTINQIVFRLKRRVGDPHGDKDMQRMEIGAFLTSYLNNPDKEKTICLPEIIKHFDTMPSMKGKLSEDEMEAIGDFLFEYDETDYHKNKTEHLSFDEAIKIAKKENQIIMVELLREDCLFCKKMEREVLGEKEIVEAIKKDFLSVIIDVEKEKLPKGLEKGLTPTFAFFNKEGEMFSVIPGAWNREDFLALLKYIKKKSKLKRELKE
jgi:thioredoxin-related protein